jgi:ribulose-phosphate 3-epimerase
MSSAVGFVAASPVTALQSTFTGSNLCSAASSAATCTKMLYGTPRPVQIIPSVLPADWANMGADCKRLENAGVDRIQFDVMDGNFVPNLTFGPELIKACRKYTSLPFETQLMVSNYNSDTMLDDYVQATKGPNGEPGVVIVHVEACTHLHRSLARIRALGGSPSVALNPHTPAEMVENVLDLVDHVLVMTVNPGFGGSSPFTKTLGFLLRAADILQLNLTWPRFISFTDTPIGFFYVSPIHFPRLFS